MGDIYEKMTVSEIPVGIVNAFVADGPGGNPAGVVLDADGLDASQMQAIAAGMGLSETVFVSKSAVAAFKLDFFTPTRRIAHCGHATIAAFSYLASLGRIGTGVTSKETIDGLRKIIIEDGAAYMEQLAPTYLDAEKWSAAGVSLETVLGSLELNPSSLDERARPAIVSTGNRFLVLGVKSGEALGNLRPDFDAIAKISEALDLIGYYIFTTERNATAMDAVTRMFAPRYGIREEGATGMAAGPLACFLHDRLQLRQSAMRIEQGRHMLVPSPSLINVRLQISGGAITGLMAGGRGVLQETRMIRRPSRSGPQQSG
jgi:PhzF family phenazine biosynthesis protein